MGVLSKLRSKKQVVGATDTGDTIKKLKAKKDMKDVDVAKSLAMYIIGTEILMAELIEDNDFIKIYDRFRRDWKLEDMINSFSNYDSLFKAVYKEVRKWIDEVSNK